MMMGGGGEVIEEKSRDEMASSSSGTGFCYSEVTTAINQTHMAAGGFVSDPDMFNLTTSMDMIGFTNAKNHHHFNDHDSSSSAAAAAAAATWQDHNRLLVDDSSFRCVFPCEGNERPSQGLSLSLSSTNPLSIGLQSFELRHSTTNNHHHHHHLHPHDHSDFFSSSSSGREKLLGKSVNIPADANNNNNNNLYQPHYALRNSKYLAPAQQLLNEFCCLGTKQSADHHAAKQPKSASHQKNNKPWEDEDNGGCGKKHHPVERRYRHYCSQMKGVVSSFEAVAGNGAARVYSALALKAMSRHFRCLKDGILGEIEKTRRSMGEKDPVAPGTTKGETPRLRIIDQTLRQQRAFQQMNMMESHPWRPQRGLPERSVSLLRAWLFEHFLHPYVSNWFINARVRLWKPMVEEMYMEEVKEYEQENNNNNNNMNDDDVVMGSSDHAAVDDEVGGNTRRNVLVVDVSADQKPIQDHRRLLRIDSDCAVSSIINNNNMNNHHPTPPTATTTTLVTDQKCSFGCVELDFSSYNRNDDDDGGDGNLMRNNINGGGGGGVSLTLGLQQDQDGENNGVSLAFHAPPTHHHHHHHHQHHQNQGSIFFGRDQMEECQVGGIVHQYTLLDAEPQNLPYRNLMGAQLLHDLAG
ncbi:homeobox protein BEL1-like protein [Senna tora]|uniref:Homeobox protein BEL1-like protein n=1 Tax=Senna tora TaxID=362788 RepID=A0A834W9E5_9FABA|nr:homeobox protein BEL1-like protein [Senna tora]